MKKSYLSVLFLLFVFFSHAQFTTGNLVVVRLGDGVTVYNGGAAARCFLDEYTTAGTFVQSVPMPVTTSGANRRFMLNNGFTGGLITLSLDNRYLLLPGYDVAESSQPLTSLTAAVAPRIVARINKNAVINTTTVTGAYDGEAVESAYSPNGTDIAVAGSSGNPVVTGTGGVRYVVAGGTSSLTVNLASLSNYQLNVFNNQLYLSSEFNNVSIGVFSGTFPVTVTPSITNLPGLPTTGATPVGYFFADLDNTITGVDVLYMCDRNAFGGATGNTITKYSLVAGSWVKNNSVAVTNPLGLTATVSGSTVTLYATSSTKLYSLVDASGYNSNISASLTTLATASANTTFKGLAFAPSVSDGVTAVREEEFLNVSKVFQSSAASLQVAWTAKKTEVIILSITDLSGRTVYRSSTKATAGFNERSLPIQSLARGSYVLKITNGREQKVHQFIKQ
ncbi:T9SS type A sorting domain-containing protein [Lacibacter luteus]|uniref:T9SS type A sorting domain-containing protein n=1 Tax=Lacibacter luteus TaxID=2508719 RepID=A0A4Q1CI43_9BACT|nr:T9SS type A sorting domain-containing protein [Lacibacter luteus]RXK59775.1 T9SS type A sorting domain-containing protein [Lacibacter luteus]